MKWKQHNYIEENIIDLSFDLFLKKLIFTRPTPLHPHIMGGQNFKAAINFSDETFVRKWSMMGKEYNWRGKKA
jgi:hypothetical protein